MRPVLGRGDDAVADEDGEGPGGDHRRHHARVGPASPRPGAGGRGGDEHHGHGHDPAQVLSATRAATTGAIRPPRPSRPSGIGGPGGPGRERRRGDRGRPASGVPPGPDQHGHRRQAGEIVVRLRDRPEAEHDQVADRPPPGEPDAGPGGTPRGRNGRKTAIVATNIQGASSRANRPRGSRADDGGETPAEPAFMAISRYQTRAALGSSSRTGTGQESARTRKSTRPRPRPVPEPAAERADGRQVRRQRQLDQHQDDRPLGQEPQAQGDVEDQVPPPWAPGPSSIRADCHAAVAMRRRGPAS